jgi:hypothetical protein
MKASLHWILGLSWTLGCAALAHADAVDPSTVICPVGVAPVAALTTTVVDAATGRAVGGALVSWHTAEHAMRGSTDPRGRFAFTVPVAPGGEALALTIQRNGYLSHPASIRACPGNNPPLAVRITRDTKFATLEGRVIDRITGKGVSGALIAILVDGYPQGGLSATTGETGSYTIRNIGFGDGLTIRVELTSPRPNCVAPVTRQVNIAASVVVENFSVAAPTTAWIQCPPTENGDLSGKGEAANTGAGVAAPEASPADGPAAAQGLENMPLQDLPVDSSIQWHFATSQSILMDDSINAWNSGHINDVLKIGPSGVLVASDAAGVWSLSYNSQHAAAIPLSYGWNAVTMTSLAQGPDGSDHVYAGTYGAGPTNPGGVLWETDTSVAFPLLKWHRTNPKPPCDSINHILVLPQARRIVVACTPGNPQDPGVFWSVIPPAPAAHGTYHWLGARAAPGLNLVLTRAFARLARGPAAAAGGTEPGTIVASAWNGTTPKDLIFVGAWSSNGELLLHPANVANPSPQQYGRTTVASCPSDPHTVYAVSSVNASDSFSQDLGAVWKSTDGGESWSLVSSPPNGAPPNSTGHQGYYNQALAVSPASCATLAIGWQYSSFASFDGGLSYPMTLNGATSGCGSGGCNLHDDYHALIFDPFDPQTLWFGTDGGLASATGVALNGSPVFASYYNQYLADLEFYHTSASFRTNNLAAGPLQDNAVVYAVLPNQWNRVFGSSGDGAYTEFAGVGPPSGPTAPGTDTLLWGNGGAWNASTWDGGTFGTPAAVPPPLSASVNWNVRRPLFSNAAGELMYGVAGLGSAVYGLFAGSDGSDLHWEHLGDIGGGQTVTAVSSYNGTVVFVGTDQGNICQLTQPYSGPCVNFTINQLQVGAINGVLEFFSSVGLAATSSGHVLRLVGAQWNAVTGLPASLGFLSVDGPALGSIFVATNDRVFVTHDLGSTWLLASDGLPAVVQSNELHYALNPDGQAYMYLSTYGWSMFRAALP